MVKRGRKCKPYRASDGKYIDGLYRRRNGVWRITATGKEFTEPDEQLALARFRQWQRTQESETIVVSVPTRALLNQQAVNDAIDQGAVLVPARPGKADTEFDGEPRLEIDVPESMLWPWFREQLLRRPEIVAEKVGIRQLANLRDMALPRASIRLSELIRAYVDFAKGKERTKARAKKTWATFCRITGAGCLRDLTAEKFLLYSDGLNSAGHAPGTVASYFKRIKAVIAFGLKRGLDAAEIRGALDRAKLLDIPEGSTPDDPHPISRADFHTLLSAADEPMKTILLTSLNCCMHFEEVLDLLWNEIDLTAGTLVTRRSKTGVIRVAVLWPRTIEALKKLTRTPDHVFKSHWGQRYSANRVRALFRELRTKAGLPKELKHNWVRDGAYSAACATGVELHLAKILAGQKTGQPDAYIMRNPGMVRAAIDAVDRKYFR